MKPRNVSPEGEWAPPAHRQLSLAIGGQASCLQPKPPAGQRLRGRSLRRTIALDEILWMGDVVQLTGKHRCTIHRWMNQGVFPKKNAPRSRPTGWLRSTIEQWLLGPSSPSGREV
jgi:predicted DNA-binding transcriptional regulator AlpA